MLWNIQEVIDSNYYIIKISEETIITRHSDYFQFYSYEKGQLTSKRNKEIVDCIYDICSINDSEIAIYYYKDGKIYGYNAFLLFYDIEYYEKIKTLKLGDGEEGKIIKSINKDTLILDRNSKIVIIDAKKRSIYKEIKFEHSINSIILLNENNFLITNNYTIYQCEINYFNLTINKEKDIKSNIIDKYPGNKLIISKDKEIYIYEMKEVHYRIMCDRCGMHPLIGIRYKCEECEDFDYCESCYEKDKESHGHTFKIIKQ